ncbi:MAG TPA: hypothetical protein EYG02_04615 [Henriciella marina]|uniref:M56 family metallopeptidase n=1 Tax=Henriciella sp. TaxID=1968823 RepID=UPI00183CBAFC|nr:M56 family metallopeptidase [Henriciella sp.]HIG22929.1 hypothetical protein [Henriciella sp.]HIK64294.1 hypothetical protein [Henriciella marina]
MTFFNELHPLLLNSIQTSLAVGFLFGLVLVVRCPFARQFGAKAAYALWLVPLARLAMPPLPANISLFGFLAPTEPQHTVAVSSITERMNAVAVDAGTVAHARAFEAPAAPVAPLPAPVEAAEPGMLEALMQIAPQLILPVWIAGSVLVLATAWRKQAVFHGLIRDDSEPASDQVAELTAKIANELGVKRSYDVRSSLLNGSPLVTGLVKPVILLPAWFEDDYSPREQRDALTHELTHVKRNDLLALQAAQLVLALQWFNPLAHLAMRAFRVDQEAACDADVLRAGTSSAFSYGQTLVKAARLAGPADGAFRGANLTLTHPIKERLILMQNTAPTLRRRLLGSTLALTLGSAAIVATASCAANASPQETANNELAGGTKTVERHAKVYRFSSNGNDDDRQFVLLSDPFQKLSPRLERLEELDLSDLEAEMNVLALELDDLGELHELEGLAAMGELSELSGLAELGNLSFDFDLTVSDLDEFGVETVETENGVKIIIPGRELMLSRNGEGALSLDVEELETFIEAHAEKIEHMAERHAERAERQAERIALVIEERVEARAERMEELGEQMELRIERAFENGLEEDLEAAGAIVEEMADQCEDREDDLNTPTIISFTDNGETYRALCVNGPSDRLRDEDVTAFIANNPELTEAERARFNEDRSYSYSYSWSEN